MKYVRKIVALLIGVVFFASLIIGLGVIFAVRNINVTLITYANDYSADYDAAKEKLKGFKGESIVFIETDDIVKTFSDSAYVVESCTKKYPATINVVLKQRLESFAIFVGGLYSMYDSDGEFLRRSINNENIVDASPNVELTMPVEKIKEVAKIAGEFKSNFNALRSILSSISLDENENVDGYVEKLIFHLRSGVVVQIDDYKNNSAEKIEAAFKKYENLTDRQKLSGKIRSYKIGGESGVINADYSAN